MTDVYIISGFLGAGKTTLIRKLLDEAPPGEKTVIVENDFGDVGIDAALLRTTGAEVAEISAGCICCTLSGDLPKTLKKLIGRYGPDRIVIEPSGVGKLSDVAEACADEGLRGLAELRRKITVVDASRHRSYLDNFGEFFADQIENADVVLLSRDDAPRDADDATAMVSRLNARAEVFRGPWADIDAEALFSAGARAAEGRRAAARVHDGRHHDAEHHADDVFDTVTIRTERAFGADDLKARLLRMEAGSGGTVLRAKGVLRGTDGYLSLQYLPGDARVESCAGAGEDGNALCVIGRGLDGPGLAALFDGAF